MPSEPRTELVEARVQQVKQALQGLTEVEIFQVIKRSVIWSLETANDNQYVFYTDVYDEEPGDDAEDEGEEEKPIVKGPIDGNIFAVIGAASRVLQRAGQTEKARELVYKCTNASSYEAALAICMEYVEFDLEN